MSEAAQLLSHAERCFRLALGPVDPRLADELEGLGHTFEREGRQLEVAIRGHRVGVSRRTCDKDRSKRDPNKP